MALHLELGNPADPFRVSAKAGGAVSDLDPALMFSSKYKPAICERHVVTGPGGTFYFSRTYPTFPLVIGCRNDGLYPWRESASTWSGNFWFKSHDLGFWFNAYQDRVTWATAGGLSGTFLFFVIGNIT